MSKPEDLQQSSSGPTRDADPSSDADAVRTAWEEYRAECFLRPGPMLIWVWSASHEFDLAPVGLHLERTAGARLDVGTHLLSLALPHLANPELHEWHLVPLARLKAASLAAIQPAAVADLALQAQALLASQQAAQARLNQLVNLANLWRLLPGSAAGTVQ